MKFSAFITDLNSQRVTRSVSRTSLCKIFQADSAEKLKAFLPSSVRTVGIFVIKVSVILTGMHSNSGSNSKKGSSEEYPKIVL
uniref:Uncharacterized protein n=1 Tax=Anguilla anguilla TaxID=7936 RepID=A0A0E9PPC3_ANGAN